MSKNLKYRFKKLNNLAQIKAVYDYFKGWAETHGEDDMDFNEVYDLLLDLNEDDWYMEDGTLIEEDCK